MDGEDRRSHWANIKQRDGRLLHFAATRCYPAAVSLLLEAGADEGARDSEGRIPRAIIGMDICADEEVRVDRAKEVVRRMLQRGPVYRARSWAWPSDTDAGGSDDGDTAAVAAAVVAAADGDDGDAILWSPAVKFPPVDGVRIFRPKEESGRKLFVRLVGR